MAEGFLPYVLRALRRRRTRSSYHCLSKDYSQPGAALHTQSLRHLPPSPSRLEGRHRRHASMEEFGGGAENFHYDTPGKDSSPRSQYY